MDLATLSAMLSCFEGGTELCGYGRDTELAALKTWNVLFLNGAALLMKRGGRDNGGTL